MNIQAALSRFLKLPLADASLQLLNELGYKSDRTVDLSSTKPEDFLGIITQMVPGATFDRAKALFDDWSSANLLFQLTDDNVSGQNTLFKETAVAPGLLRSYLFFAVELTGSDYSRTKLTGIARQLNRLFPMPVMVFIKHWEKDKPALSIAVINRARNKREASKDVLGKVTIIRSIALENTHRGHVDILDSLRVENLKHPQRLPINNFDALHTAWEEIFNVELLNQRFYRDLSNWFFWALPQVDFPSDVDSDSERRRATSLIRLLTRLIFCWFLKERRLIPEDIFIEAELKKILKDLDDDSSSFHEAILQNLFFATLNQRMGTNPEGQPYRAFAKDEGFQKNKTTYGVDTLFRYEEHFQNPDEIVSRFADVPFLNGGLFECLDRTEEEIQKKAYVDGFSRNPKKRPNLPNRLFFSPELKVDLSDAYGEPKRKNETVRGLIRLLNSYKFTIVENTPLDQEIALDPELLGKVFENLLASYNSETKTTARKQTGSFYTPRPIVDYIVDESLKSYLSQVLVHHGSEEDLAKAGLEKLLGYGEEKPPFTSREQDLLLEAIHQCKILDPACGSGAFPMGMLHKLVHLVHKLDPQNQKWKQLQIDAAQRIPDSNAREAAIAAIEEAFNENDADYGRKLYLIENCLFGADIQPIAIQITKLRFFISLICDQREARHKENRGIRPLPNLETKFVAANTLLALESKVPEGDLFADDVRAIEKQIAAKYHDHFNVRSRREKLELQRSIRKLRQELGKMLGSVAGEESKLIAAWDPFDQQQTAGFFDPHWMFGPSLTEGFDIVFGNPPYVQIQKLPIEVKEQLKSFSVKRGKGKVEVRSRFETFDSMGDIYCLFYERGAQLLKPGGTLSYITSNKWMRAGYGVSLRDYFSNRVRVKQVVDFGGNLVFSTAMVDTVIVVAERTSPAESHPSVVIPKECDIERELGAFVSHNSVKLKNTYGGESTWVILSPERQRIKEMVEAQGVPLEKWDIQINYGIKTGFNEAFYITSEEKVAFCREDPRCAELLVPLLTGADIKRYGAEWDGTWMLFIPWHFPLHEDPSIKGDSKVAEQALMDRYPVIYRHLLSYKKQLSARNKAETGIRYEWYALQRWAADYHAEFAKPKIIYPNMTKYLPFFVDRDRGFFVNDKGFILTSEQESLGYLVSVLNSSLFRCCFIDNFPNLGEDRRELRKIFFDKIHIRRPHLREVELFEPLVGLVQFARRPEENGGAGDEMRATFLEDLIDACVMECYFRDHMAERDLLFHDQLRPLLAGYDANASHDAQLEFLHQFYETVNAPAHPIRNQLIRLTAESPDLLAVIKREGAV
jgi:adenine-specific DNA-methyltransferase